MTRPAECPACGRARPKASCPGCGRPAHDQDDRLRAAVRRYWSGDTEALLVIDDFERAARGQGCRSFADGLMSAFREATGTWGVPPAP